MTHPQMIRPSAFQPDPIEDDEPAEMPDTCLAPDGHWYVITYGRARWEIHAEDCETCADACAECRSREDVTPVRCQLDADSLCDECMNEHVRECIRCEQG